MCRASTKVPLSLLLSLSHSLTLALFSEEVIAAQSTFVTFSMNCCCLNGCFIKLHKLVYARGAHHTKNSIFFSCCCDIVVVVCVPPHVVHLQYIFLWYFLPFLSWCYLTHSTALECVCGGLFFCSSLAGNNINYISHPPQQKLTVLGFSFRYLHN